MPVAIIRHCVGNYEAWRPHFDRHENARLAHGFRNARVYRNADDPGDLIVTFDVADESLLNSAESNDELRRIMREAGLDLMQVSIGMLPD
jgi:hypothetical protein